MRTLPPRPAAPSPTLIEVPWAEHVLDLRVDGRGNRSVPNLPDAPLTACMDDVISEVPTQFTDDTGWTLTLVPGPVATTMTSISRSTGQQRTRRKLDWVAAIDAPDGSRSGLTWSFLDSGPQRLSHLLGIPLATPLGNLARGWDDTRSWAALRHLHHTLLDPWSWAGVPDRTVIAARDLHRMIQWAPHGIDATTARFWSDRGISTGRYLMEWRKACPDDEFIAQWCGVVDVPEAALLWAVTGATPDVAAAWEAQVSPADLAVTLYRYGWNLPFLDSRHLEDRIDAFRDRLRRRGRSSTERALGAVTVVRAAHRAGLTPDDALSLLDTVDDPARVATLADLAVGAGLSRRDALALLASPLTLVEARKALANGGMDFDAVRLMGALSA